MTSLTCEDLQDLLADEDDFFAMIWKVQTTWNVSWRFRYSVQFQTRDNEKSYSKLSRVGWIVTSNRCVEFPFF